MEAPAANFILPAHNTRNLSFRGHHDVGKFDRYGGDVEIEPSWK
jgi:hypothetical protein